MIKFNPKHKFNNKKMSTPDGDFDSKGEWERWLFLKEAQKKGQISDLRRQVKYTLIPTQYRTEIVHLKTKDKVVQRVAEREITYTADFVYEKPTGREVRVEVYSGHGDEFKVGNMMRDETALVVEDFKGFPNDRWPLKKAMMLYFHGVAIREVKKPTEPI